MRPLRQSEQLVNEAKGYAAKILTEARGEERREIAQAEAYRDRILAALPKGAEIEIEVIALEGKG